MAKEPKDIDFSDLEDSEAWDRVDTSNVKTGLDEISAAKGAIYEEKCKKCHGSGRFISYSGRDVGPCFKCKGEGIRRFKTSPESREHLKEKRVERKARKVDDQAARVAQWLADNPERAQWLKQTWEFAQSLNAALHKYGSLTERQAAAMDKSIDKQRVRDEERAKVRSANTTDLDLSELRSGMYAVPDGTRLKLRVNAPTKGKWVGWVFVDDGAEYGQRRKYGSQRPGERYVGEVVDELRAIMADPFEASKAYGKLVGRCGVCGRTLEDEKSVAAGIGPVCASRF